MRALVTGVTVMAVALSGCSGERAGSAASPASASPSTCKAAIGDFVEQLDDLDARLEAGALAFATFVGMVDELHEFDSAVMAARAEAAGQSCHREVFARAVRALDAYSRARRMWLRCDVAPSCGPRDVIGELDLLWAKASIALRGLTERLGITAGATAVPSEICALVAEAEELGDAVRSGIMEVDAIALAQDLQNDLIAVRNDLTAAGRDDLEDEITALLAALADLSTRPEAESDLRALDLAVRDLACPDAEEDPTPLA